MLQFCFYALARGFGISAQNTDTSLVDHALYVLHYILLQNEMGKEYDRILHTICNKSWSSVSRTSANLPFPDQYPPIDRKENEWTILELLIYAWVKAAAFDAIVYTQQRLELMIQLIIQNGTCEYMSVLQDIYHQQISQQAGEARKAAVKARQAAMVAKLEQQGREFMKNQTIEDTSMETQSDSNILQCTICHSEGEIGAFGYFAQLLKGSTAYYPTFQFSTGTEMYYRPLDAGHYQTVLTSCQHVAHAACYSEYQKMVSRQRWGHRHLVPTLTCPTCKAISNVWLPCDLTGKWEVKDVIHKLVHEYCKMHGHTVEDHQERYGAEMPMIEYILRIVKCTALATQSALELYPDSSELEIGSAFRSISGIKRILQRLYAANLTDYNPKKLDFLRVENPQSSSQREHITSEARQYLTKLLTDDNIILHASSITLQEGYCTSTACIPTSIFAKRRFHFPMSARGRRI